MLSVVKRRKNNNGATLVLFAICIVALVCVMALAIDLGQLYVAKQRAQNVADAAAIGGACLLNGHPESESPALDEANSLGSANNAKAPSWQASFEDATPEVIPEGTVVKTAEGDITVGAYQAMRVKCRVPVTFAFAPIFDLFGGNHKSGSAPASAIAMFRAKSKVNFPIVPWVVPDTQIWENGDISANVGERMQLKVTDQKQAFTENGNFLCVSYASDSGGNDYRSRIKGIDNKGKPLPSFEVKVGDVIKPENGNMKGPTTQGLMDDKGNAKGRLIQDDLFPVSVYDQYNSAYTAWKATYDPITGKYADTPRIVVLPVAQNPPPNDNIVVIGFAAFFIDYYDGSGNVYGYFLTAHYMGDELIIGNTSLSQTGTTNLITEVRLTN